jgi:hypothetical protein
MNAGSRVVFEIQANYAYTAALDLQRAVTLTGLTGNNSIEDCGCVQELKRVTAFVIAKYIVCNENVMAPVLSVSPAKAKTRNRRGATLNVFEAIVRRRTSVGIYTNTNTS